jgi:hypothetical protein
LFLLVISTIEYVEVVELLSGLLISNKDLGVVEGKWIPFTEKSYYFLWEASVKGVLLRAAIWF